MRTIVATIAGGVTMLLPFFANAVIPDRPPESIVSEHGIEGVGSLLTRLSGWIWGLILALSVIFILIAAFSFLTAGGEEEKIRKAKAFLLYAVVAVGVGALATGIVYVVLSFFGVANPS